MEKPKNITLRETIHLQNSILYESIDMKCPENANLSK